MPKRAVAITSDPRVLSFCEVALPLAGYELILLSRTESVLESVYSAQPELILLDLDLCGEVAAGVLHWIGGRQCRPGLVLLSSGENLGLLREGFVVPDFQLLIKPLGRDEMEEAVLRASRRVRSFAVQATRDTRDHGPL